MTSYTNAQRKLIGALIGLARALDETNSTYEVLCAMITALKLLCRSMPADKDITPDTEGTGNANATVTVSVTDDEINAQTDLIHAEKNTAVPDCATCLNPCGRTFDFDMGELDNMETSLAGLKLELVRQLCLYADKAVYDTDNYSDVLSEIVRGLFAVGYDGFDAAHIEADIARISERLRKFTETQNK